jgi:hypothetical protein
MEQINGSMDLNESFGMFGEVESWRIIHILWGCHDENWVQGTGFDEISQTLRFLDVFGVGLGLGEPLQFVAQLS